MNIDYWSDYNFKLNILEHYKKIWAGNGLKVPEFEALKRKEYEA